MSEKDKDDRMEKLLKKEHFEILPQKYDRGWLTESGNLIPVLQDKLHVDLDKEEQSWSIEAEELHSEPTKTGWIDVYERERVINTLSHLIESVEKPTIIEFGCSEGYMIAEMNEKYPKCRFVATDLMPDGLRGSYRRNPQIAHVQCDFTDAPFADEAADILFSLNVLEHISADEQCIKECYRVIKKGGYCLFVVPRGERLYDYFDEMLYHKRRYAKGELRRKCENAGFETIDNFHFAWLCYPAFWLKKKMNQQVGKRLSQEEKMKRCEADVKNAMASPLAIGLMHFEQKISKIIAPNYGVREFILCKKK